MPRKNFEYPDRKNYIKGKLFQRVFGFSNRFMNYTYDVDLGRFRCVEFNLFKYVLELDTNLGIQTTQGDTFKQLQEYFGQGNLELPVPSNLKLFYKEVLHPFFIFQVFSAIVWLIEGYYYFLSVIVVITLSSSIISLVMVKKNLLKLRELGRIDTQVWVLRDGAYKKVPNSEIVPGDIVRVGEGDVIPFDMVMIRG